MKKYFPIVIAIGLLAGFYFIAQNSASSDKDNRIIDESIQAEYNKLRMDYLNSTITQKKYFIEVQILAKKESELFSEVRNHKFENVTESNYWHRGRLKFPSNIMMEKDRIDKAIKGSSPQNKN